MKIFTFIILLFGFAIITCCCSHRVGPKLFLNLNGKYAFVDKGKISSIDIVIAPDTGRTNFHVKIENSTDSIFFAKQMDSLVELSSSNKLIELYFKTIDNNGNHLFQFHFNRNEIETMENIVKIDEVID